MKYIICALALFLTACDNSMPIAEVKARESYCYKNGAKGVNMLVSVRSKSVHGIRCVFNGYETDSEYVEEKK